MLCFQNQPFCRLLLGFVSLRLLLGFVSLRLLLGFVSLRCLLGWAVFLSGEHPWVLPTGTLRPRTTTSYVALGVICLSVPSPVYHRAVIRFCES